MSEIGAQVPHGKYLLTLMALVGDERHRIINSFSIFESGPCHDLVQLGRLYKASQVIECQWRVLNCTKSNIAVHIKESPFLTQLNNRISSEKAVRATSAL
jgi:hypothetical protein